MDTPGGSPETSARRRLRGPPRGGSPERPAKTAAGERFFYVTDKEALRVTAPESLSLIKGNAGDAMLKESERCWAKHYATGLNHSQPPWKQCAKLDDNREHPLCVQWLDTIEIPTLAELLKSPSLENNVNGKHKDVGNGNDSVMDNGNSVDKSNEKK